MNIFHYFIKKLLDILYPVRCPYCESTMTIFDFACIHCQKNLKIRYNMLTLHSDCGIIYNCISPLIYDGLVRNSILKFKFRGYTSFAKPFAFLMVKAVNDIFKGISFDCVTDVPIKFSKSYHRDYNQSTLLAKSVAEFLNISYLPLLNKVKVNVFQHTLSSFERAENVKNAYSIINSEMVNNKTILLCDDIVTTGSTLGECANVLYRNGAKKVLCVTIAYAKKTCCL